MSVVTDLEAQADLFGTFRVTVFYRNDEGEEGTMIVHGVSQEAVDASVSALLAVKLSPEGVLTRGNLEDVCH